MLWQTSPNKVPPSLFLLLPPRREQHFLGSALREPVPAASVPGVLRLCFVGAALSLQRSGW